MEGINRYQQKAFADLGAIRKALESIADSQKRIADATEGAKATRERIAKATEATAMRVTKYDFVPKTPREKGGL